MKFYNISYACPDGLRNYSAIATNSPMKTYKQIVEAVKKSDPLSNELFEHLLKSENATNVFADKISSIEYLISNLIERI